MEVIDNFLDKDSFDFFKQEVTSNYFPWYFNENKVKTSNNIDDYQFVNIFQDGNTGNFLLDPFKKKLEVSDFIRAKLNCTTRTNKIHKFPAHKDMEVDCNICVFYVNTNNGYTEFENGKKVKSVENRAVIFDNNIKHFGTTSTDTKRRMVLNLAFKKSIYIGGNNKGNITL